MCLGCEPRARSVSFSSSQVAFSLSPANPPPQSPSLPVCNEDQELKDSKCVDTEETAMCKSVSLWVYPAPNRHLFEIQEHCREIGKWYHDE
jgi:hypothetical protein